jgi:phosphatidate cytidylyltransferase
LTDIGAYFVGRAWGRIKLAPHLSPNKTLEGALGGLGLAIGVNVLLGLFPEGFRLYGSFSVVGILISTLIVSCAGQLGDLFESWLKRRANLKDSGRFLPGHGGALDRLDSIIFGAPLLLALWEVIMGL